MVHFLNASLQTFLQRKGVGFFPPWRSDSPKQFAHCTPDTGAPTCNRRRYNRPSPLGFPLTAENQIGSMTD